VSLRVRLVLVVLVLTGVGLVVSGVATTSALRRYLLRRVDERMEGVEGFAIRRLDDPAPGSPAFVAGGGGFVGGPGGNGEVFAARFDAHGAVVTDLASPFSDATSVLAGVPSGLLTRARQGTRTWGEVTVTGVRYRVLAEPIAGSSDVAVVMSPLGDVDATVAQLQWLATGVGVVLLIAAAGGGLWLVTIGLRPLAHMAETADAIAVGDLDRRVETAGGREVTALAHALNNAFDARQASEHKLRRFVTDASHELRTPLTTIRGYAELLRRGAIEPDAVRTAAGRIEGEAVRMGGLVEDLLLLARLDQGRPLDDGTVDLVALAADAVADVGVVAPHRPITLTALAPVLVRGDEGRLRQVIANLVTNAREHTPADTAIDVAVTGGESDAVLTVRDRGPGLGVDALEHAFERFWRADPARGHRPGAPGGSGLGLAIVAAIAAAHGGAVDAANAPDGGAVFTLTLPAGSQATPNQSAARSQDELVH
jgi:two-component system OmpR family sensor kinase